MNIIVLSLSLLMLFNLILAFTLIRATRRYERFRSRYGWEMRRLQETVSESIEQVRLIRNTNTDDQELEAETERCILNLVKIQDDLWSRSLRGT